MTHWRWRETYEAPESRFAASCPVGMASHLIVGFPLLQPVIPLEFFQHRILRSKYLNFLEEFFIVFISDIFGKFRKSQQAAED